MEDNSDSCAVPSLNIVVEEIFSSCSKSSNDVVPASTLIEFMTPHLSNHVIGLTHLRNVLDPNNENPPINRKTFYEAMRSWTAKINESDSKLFNLSFKESDVFDENGVPFHQSTPKPSLEPTTMKNSNNLLDFSNLSATSFTANMRDNSIRMDKLLFIEERYQELEHKHLNNIKELTLVKSQLATCEEQYAELKQDLDRTNKRLMLEQQVNADLQKSMEHNDEFKEEVCNTKKEKEHAHRMWLSTKRENVNLLAQMKSLTFEKELLDRKLNEMQRKQEQKKKEFVDLQTLFSLYEDENKILKKSKNDLEEELQETKASLEHYTEVSEILKNKLEALTTANKEKGSDLSKLNLTKDPSISSNSSETSLQSGNSTFETIEDLDLSSFSDNLRTSNGQDLLSELQECKFLDNHNKCYIEEHTELLRIVKEHDNCLQIISDKDKEIEIISAEINSTGIEYKTFLNKYKNVENDIKCLEEHLKTTKIENEELAKKNEDYAMEIANLKQKLDSNNNELQNMTELNKKRLELTEEIDQIKEQREQDIKMIYNLKNEKESLRSRLETLVKEKHEISSEKNNLSIENMNLTSIIEINRKELNEMKNLKIQNEELEKQAILMKLDDEQNREEITKLSNKLLNCKDKGKTLIEKFNMQIKEQNEKIQFLKEFSDKFQEFVSDVQGTIEETRTKLNLLLTYVEDNYVNVKYVHKNDEDSASTGSNESCSYHNRSKQGSSSGRRSNYEKQQLKINRLEEKIEELENELANEKSITERLKGFECQINNLEMEKINHEEEKRSVLRELEATKYDLCMKEQMMRQFEEKHKFDLDNLNKSYEKEIELTKVAQSEAWKNKELKEVYLIEQIEELNNKLSDVQKEKKLFENLLEKQGDKIVTLKKALSDMSTSTEETKNFDMLLTEKESMLNFNRQLLLKANNSLKQVENRCLFLELLLDKCKMVLLETVGDVLSSAVEVFHTYRNTLERKGVDPKVIHQVEMLETRNPTFEHFTEKEVWLAHNHLTLISKLLKALVSDGEEYSGCSCGKDATTSKSVNKFTLRPPKLQLLRLPSCDPDISSSSMKDSESDQNVKFDFNPENDEVMEEEEVKEAEKGDSLDNLGANDSETNWLDSYNDDLREEMNNRKATEKKFIILSTTWKTNLKNTKAKYRTLKHRCPTLKDTYLRVLLQIVTYIKNHNCHQEQNTLIHALKLIEKLKDLLFDIFKLAEQYGASRQELHSIKCWDLIVEYVNRLHQENRLLKLYQCTSVEITDAPNNSTEQNCTETTDSKKSYRSIGVGDSSIDSKQSTTELSQAIEPNRRKCSSFIMVTSTIICLLSMCLLFIHIECIRNGNETIMCPLDMFVSIKYERPESSTY